MQSYRTTFLDFDARPKPKTDLYCIRCQKDIKPGAQHRMVRLVDGGYMVLHPEDDAKFPASGDDYGLHRIGTDCAKKLGLEWTRPAPKPEP